MSPEHSLRETRNGNCYSIDLADAHLELLLIDPVLGTAVLRKLALNESEPGMSGLLGRRLHALCQSADIEIMSDSREIQGMKNQFLEKSGFIIYRKKNFYEKYLEEHIPGYEDPFDYCSIREIGEKRFLEIFADVTADDSERTVEARQYYAGMVESAGERFSPDNWKAVILDGRAVGIIMPQVYPDKPEEGSVFHIGLVPEFRKKGYGKILHAQCLRLLKEEGVRRYVGSTAEGNLAMNRTFDINGCTKIMTRYFYRAG